MAVKQKHSAKREAILALLQSTKSHPGARWVYEQLKPQIPGLSLGTVYRNLSSFRKEGKALFLGVIGGEERFDGITEPHPHLICSCCGTVFDLSPDRAKALIQNCRENLPGKGSFVIDFRKTLFYGLCRTCRGLRHEGSGNDPAA